MEDGLLYLYYFEDNKEQSIDFGSQYKFTFDHNSNTLYVEDNPHYIPEFYNTKGVKNIQNLSLLVGANGSGKTKLLRRIIGSMGSYNMIYEFLSDSIAFFVIRIRNKNHIVIDKEYEIKIKSKENFEFLDAKTAWNLIDTNYNLILLSNVFDSFHRDHMLTSFNSVTDLTTSDRYQEQFDFVEKQHKRKGSDKKRYEGKLIGQQKDFDEIVNLLFSNEDIDFLFKYKKSIDFTRNLKLLVSRLQHIKGRADDTEIVSSLNVFINFIESFDKEFEGIPDRYSRNDFNITYIKKTLILFFYGIAYIHLTSRTNENSSNWSNVPFKNHNTDNYSEESIDESLKKLEDYIKEILEQDFLYEIISGLFKLIDDSESIIPDHTGLQFQDIKIFKEAFDLCKKVDSQYNYFTFKISGISSGEYAALILFSRLYGWKQEKEEESNILLLVDEVDLYLHPQWQKQIISRFIEFCNTVLHDKKVQIIMTTNNAIPVSDVLKYNVVLLGQDKKQHFDNYRNTFGGNIFNLLNDTFFIQDGFIGEFAQMKIQELIDMLYEKDIMYLVEHMDEIEKHINLVGEDLIKNKLLEILEQRLSANLLSIKRTLNGLEERISNLEKRKNE